MGRFTANVRSGDVKALAQRVDQELTRFCQRTLASLPFTFKVMCILLDIFVTSLTPATKRVRDGAAKDHSQPHVF